MAMDRNAGPDVVEAEQGVQALRESYRQRISALNERIQHATQNKKALEASLDFGEGH